MSFNPAKVSLMSFAVVFKILSTHCETGTVEFVKKGGTLILSLLIKNHFIIKRLILLRGCDMMHSKQNFLLSHMNMKNLNKHT